MFAEILVPFGEKAAATENLPYSLMENNEQTSNPTLFSPFLLVYKHRKPDNIL